MGRGRPETLPGTRKGLCPVVNPIDGLCYIASVMKSTDQRRMLRESSPVWSSPQGWGRFFWFFWMWLCTSLAMIYLKLLNRIRLEGLEHIPQNGPVLIVCNHISDLDPVVLMTSLLVRFPTTMTRAVAKMELFKTPFRSWILHSFGCISVNRNGRDIRAMRQILYALRRERVLIFPEGTRSMDGRPLRGKRTVGRFIQWSRPVIVPAAVWGTIEALPPRNSRLRIGKELGVRFGRPLDMEAFYELPWTKEASQEIVDHLMAEITKIVEELKDEGRVIEIGTVQFST